jgi:murein DD-endopeptidase MepM/ murein hydrolase activator NlpD
LTLGVLLLGCSAPAGPTLAPVAPARPPESAAASEIPKEYAAARDRARQVGRAVIGGLIGGDFAAVREKLAEDVKPLLTEVAMQETMNALHGAGKLSDRQADSATPGLYEAEYLLAGKTLVFVVELDRTGLITALLVRPRTELLKDPHADYVSENQFRLPFENTWWVFWGGDTELSNYHVVAPDQRHAYDIVMWKGGASHEGDGRENEQYYAFGQQLVAPADGAVISAANDKRDNKPGVETDAENPLGNHVILDVGNSEYLVMAHMKKGSVVVKNGDRVTAGQPLGACGNSGNTTEPHLHIHLQDKPDWPSDAKGLPLAFSRYMADGKDVGSGRPVRGQFVRNAR